MPEVQYVQVVDEQSLESLGVTERTAAHTAPGVLHLAVSVVLFRSDGQVLFQRRHDSKAAFGGWWANACCTHPKPGEEPSHAAHRRVEEELGAKVELAPAGSFLYAAADQTSAVWEREYDHVFYATVGDDWEATPDATEISATAWVAPSLAAAQFEGRLAPWANTATEIADSARRAAERPAEAAAP